MPCGVDLMTFPPVSFLRRFFGGLGLPLSLPCAPAGVKFSVTRSQGDSPPWGAILGDWFGFLPKLATGEHRSWAVGMSI